MPMPNFFVIAPPRSGTTSLHHLLDQHPQIYMCPIKETHFFNLEGEQFLWKEPDAKKIKRLKRDRAYQAKVTHIETYRSLFEGVSDEIAIGEACPTYFRSPKAAERIRHYVPNAKLIVILRNPVDRAYSAYIARAASYNWLPDGFAHIPRTTRSEGIEKVDVQRAFVSIGFYSAHLKRYFDTFDRAQIKVYLYRDLTSDPAGTLRGIYRFLHVDETFRPDMSVRYGATGIPRSKFLHRVIKRVTSPGPVKTFLRPFVPLSLRRFLSEIRNKNLVKPPLDPEIRQEWIMLYREDILQLQDLIQRDLSEWLEP